MVIDNKYEIGQTVYLKTDQEQVPRMVISIEVNAYDLLYRLMCGITESYHYDFEITAEKNFELI